MKRKIIIFATYSLNDPPILNTVKYILKLNWQVVVIHPPHSIPNTSEYENFKLYVTKKINLVSFLILFNKIINWLIFIYESRKIIKKESPDFIIAEMLTPLIAIPNIFLKKTICFIPDIQNIKYAGYIDRIGIKYGLKKLNNCKLVWASDIFKAELIQIQANLKKLPLVCHNCPPLNYFENLNKEESRNWLHKILINKNISVSNDSMILLRAGAIGPHGGIEATIYALKDISENIVFIMMGRPSKNYHKKLIKIIAENNLTNRVYFFDKPSNNEWKKILLASDIGHLIHIRPEEKEDESIASNYDLNSSLSNNRLFQYFAAGLPIISYDDPRMDIIYNEVNCFEVISTRKLAKNIIEKINLIVKDKKKLNEMGESSRHIFEEKYNWENQFSLILKNIVNE